MFSSIKNHSFTLLLGLSLAVPKATAAPAAVDTTPVWNEVSRPLAVEKRQMVPGDNTAFSVPRGTIRSLWNTLETVIPYDTVSNDKGPLTIETYFNTEPLSPPNIYNNTNIIFTNTNANPPGMRIMHISFRNPTDGITISSRFGSPLSYQGAVTTPFSVTDASWKTNWYTGERLVRFTIEPVSGTGGSGRRYKFTFAPTRASSDNKVFTYTVPAAFPTGAMTSYIHLDNPVQPRLSGELHVGYGVPLNSLTTKLPDPCN
ncbi:hypothetical protein TWF281_007772 [Arthrobotrys megalospora]